MDLIIPESANPVDAIERFATEETKRWSEACDQFLKWERANMLLSAPSTETSRRHRAALQPLLKFTHAICEQAQTAKIDEDAKNGLTTRLRKLQASWNMFYEPMKESQPPRAEGS